VTVLVDMPNPHVLAALAALGPLERYALDLVYVERQTQQQIADRLAVPLATVSRAVSRGLQLVSKFLDAAL
jgi:RNA polymerase sigma factor (sigma-70 family)